MAKDKSKPGYTRMRPLGPKCSCGENMTHVNAIWLTENTYLIFLGNCDFDCPVNQFVLDIPAAVKDLRKKDISECKEVSGTTGEVLDGEDADEVPAAGPANKNLN